MDGRINNKRQWMLIKSLLISSFLIPFNSSAAPLDLAQSPLFIAERGTVIPNVLLMLDDSGSMDWDILTKPHWDACSYHNGYGCHESTHNYTAPTYVTNGAILDNLIIPEGTYRIPTRDYLNYIFAPPSVLYNRSDGYFSYWFDSINSVNRSVYALITAIRSARDAQYWERLQDWRVLDSKFNVTYFNPDVTYVPWHDYPEFNNAVHDPNDPNQGSINFSRIVYVVGDQDRGFTGDNPGKGRNYSTQPNGLTNLWDSHTIYSVSDGAIRRYRATANVDANGRYTGMRYSALPTITDATQYARIQRNYRNWYTYYRNRFLLLKSAINELVTTLPNYRYSLGMINSSNMIVRAPGETTNLVTHNNSLLNTLNLYRLRKNPTPLRSALDLAGRYFQTTGANAPINDACQINATLLFTDGLWNGFFAGSHITTGGTSRQPNSVSLADVAQHYYDIDLRPDLPNVVPTNENDTNNRQHMNTFVISFGLTGSNLRDTNGDGWPDVNGVRLPSNSPLWGDPSIPANTEDKINDLWHAAMNGRGAYLNATDPLSLNRALQQVLTTISARVAGSAAPVTLTTGVGQGATRIYQSRFDSRDWSGDILAYSLNSTTGEVGSDALWSAKTQLNNTTSAQRQIIFSDSTTGSSYVGRAFTASNLTPDWRTALLRDKLSFISDDNAYVTAMVNYLRGDATNERATNGFRVRRNGKLGDIVNSSPVYVGAPKEIGASYTGAEYTTFKSTYRSRPAVLYAGANDGMLHAFNAATGNEMLAYIPSQLKDKLHLLAKPDYQHQFYVNSTPGVKDVYGNFGSNASWRSILVVGFGSGAKGLAALDVTDPSNFSEANANNIVLWELGPENRVARGETLQERLTSLLNGDGNNTTSPDVGHIYDPPAIAKMNNNQWAVITGNGYNSIENDGSSARATLYILDVATGVPIKTIFTTISGGSRTSPNGLSQPVLVDTTGNGKVDIIYAGDMLGNVWKFDVSSTDPNEWGVAYSTGSTNLPLFSAGNTRPITGGLAIGPHPTGNGRLVYFGTGRYLTQSDNTSFNQADQGFYAIWDKDEPNSDVDAALRDNSLLEQEVTIQNTFTVAQSGENGAEASDREVTVRETSNHTINWALHRGWYLKLRDADDNNNGERIISTPILRNGRVIFTTLQPASSSCQSGGTSWLMELNAYTGQRLNEVSLDLNDDGVFDRYDYSRLNASGDLQCSTTTCVPPSGLLFDHLIASPAILGQTNSEIKYLSGTNGNIDTINESVNRAILGRQGWRQIYQFP